MSASSADQPVAACRAAHFPRRPPSAVVSSFKSRHGMPPPADLKCAVRTPGSAPTVHQTQAGGGLAPRFKGGASGAARRGGNERCQPPARLGSRQRLHAKSLQTNN